MPVIVMLDTNNETFPDGAHCPVSRDRTEYKLVPFHNRCGRCKGSSYEPDSNRSVKCTAEGCRNGLSSEVAGYRWHGPIVLADTHVGMCLSESERNMRDDSDFYMLVWRPELGRAENIMFATTRGWSYPCLASHVDATPEVRAAYEAWLIAEQRRYDVCRRWAQRRELARIAKEAGLETYHQVRMIKQVTASDRWDAMVKLLTGKLRSSFRKSLRDQVLSWARGESDRASPLSRKQWDYV